uniref:Uncharacterized protein n=1 Tax=Acrobeloides nanus TaxID=290746 RepID=A0A914C9D4_9BILA
MSISLFTYLSKKILKNMVLDIFEGESDKESLLWFLSKVTINARKVYDDERGQVTLMYEVMRITKNAEEILRRVEKNKPEMTVSFEIYGRTPPTDGYEM